ncbi:MAG: prepilin-type N-terminal cleavage/methylation domain-containing protein [Eubacteriales bacterium]|nr:prepilin-type N-terminal cleavage/methylation domain-containing protein [Eubacteriales bacterium]
MKKNNKGFTLAELLIVVAIIAVLVAVAIPVFTKQLEKSRDATSVANMRSAYAESQVAVLTNEESGNAGAPAPVTGGGCTVTVKDVIIKTEQANDWSEQAKDLPFKAPDDPGTSGEKSMVFTYDKDYNITGVTLN